MNNEQQSKRLSVIVSNEHFENISKLGINISTFIRGLIDDYFNESQIKISVSPETFKLYTEIVQNSGASDHEIEPHIKDVLKKLLDERLKKITSMKNKL